MFGRGFMPWVSTSHLFFFLKNPPPTKSPPLPLPTPLPIYPSGAARGDRPPPPADLDEEGGRQHLLNLLSGYREARAAGGRGVLLGESFEFADRQIAAR